MIPIKGYATFHPLKHCLVGKNFSSDFFKKLSLDPKIISPLQRIADETEEDYLKLIEILHSHGVRTYRPNFDEDKYNTGKHFRPPTCPRDHFGVIGETLYATHPVQFYGETLKHISKDNLYLNNWDYPQCLTTTANIVRCGKDLYWDITAQNTRNETDSKDQCQTRIDFLEDKWTNEGYRVHKSNRNYHSDSAFCLIKPGCIVSLHDIQKYENLFPGWEVLYLPEQSWSAVSPFLKIKEKVAGKWWVPGEEDNDKLIEFVNTWLNDWVGYVEETVFDVNMLSINENVVICNNENKEVFDFLKKHKVEPIVFNFRHRYFWDGGVHCITQDFYREGQMEDYFS